MEPTGPDTTLLYLIPHSYYKYGYMGVCKMQRCSSLFRFSIERVTEIAGEVQHSSNLCASSSTNYRTVLMGVLVSGTHSKSTTEIAGDLHRGAAQF